MEIVHFNMSVLLSQQYDILADIAEEMAEIYKKSEDLDLIELYDGYTNMGEGIRSLSELVKEQLGEYDFQIIDSYAVLMDVPVPPNGDGDGGCDPAVGDCIFGCTLLSDIGCWVWNFATCIFMGLISGWAAAVCEILFYFLCNHIPMTYEECRDLCIDEFCY